MTGGTFSGTSVSYGFDAFGRRVSRTTASTTRYLYACGCANGAPVFETNSGGTITLTSVDSPTGDMARYSGPPTGSSQVTFAYYSGLGHLAAEGDSSGARTAYYTYDPFGAGNQTVPPNSVVERWEASRDKQFDSSAGLIEMGVRSYDPALGRFLTGDPLLMGSLNLYDYASQDPLNQTDPSGLHTQSRRLWCNWGQTGFAFFGVWTGPGTTIYAWFTLRHRGGYSTYIDIVRGHWLRREMVWNLFSWYNPSSRYKVTYFDVSVPRGHISYLYVGCGWY
jgi:RHS repeat-associated protein